MWVFTIIIVFSDLSPRSGDEHIKCAFYFGSKPTILGMEWKQAFKYKYILHWNAFIEPSIHFQEATLLSLGWPYSQYTRPQVET